MNIVTMHAQQQAAMVEGNAAGTASGKGQSSVFVHTLGQMLSLDGQEQSAAGQLSMSLPIAVLLPSVLQLAEQTQTSVDVAAFLAALQTANPSELAALQQQPELRQWTQQVEELSALLFGESSSLSATASHAPAAAEEQAAPAAGNPLDSLLAALSKFQRLLETYPQQASVQQLGNQLSALLAELSAVAPNAAQAARGESASTQSVQLAEDKQAGLSALMSALRQPEGTQSQTANYAQRSDAEPTGAQLLMHKLAYMKPVLHVTGTQQSAVETPIHVMNSAEQSVQPAAAQPLTETQAAAAASASAQQVKMAEQPVALSAEAKPVPAYVMNANRFADEMSGLLIKNMKISQLAGVSEAKITLVPEHLGQLNLKIAVHNGQLTAHFAAESLYARDLLEAQLPQLRAALQLQGLQVDRLEVTTQQAAQPGAFQEQQQSSKQSGQHNGQAGGSSLRGEGDFAAEIEQAEQASRMMYGSTFIASA